MTTSQASTASVPFIDASGSSFDIGAAIGESLSDGLRAVADAHCRGVERSVGWERAIQITRELIPYAESAVPGCVAELRGMAAGSGVAFETLFSMNALQETRFLAGMDGAHPNPGDDEDEDDEDEDDEDAADAEGCTSLAVGTEATADGRVLLGHNEDAGPLRDELNYIVRARPTGRPAFVGYAYSGLLLYQGFNDAGIGSVGNALYARDIRPGVPKLLAYRDALDATFLEDAIRRTRRPARANGNNHVLANAAGDIYDMEVSGGASALLRGGDALVHANHFTDAAMRALEWGDLLNSELRQARVERLLARQATAGGVTVEGVFAILTDHSNYPKSVCKHIDSAVNPNVQTIAAVVIDLTAGELHVRAGQPCETPTVTVGLSA